MFLLIVFKGFLVLPILNFLRKKSSQSCEFKICITKCKRNNSYCPEQPLTKPFS